MPLVEALAISDLLNTIREDKISVVYCFNHVNSEAQAFTARVDDYVGRHPEVSIVKLNFGSWDEGSQGRLPLPYISPPAFIFYKDGKMKNAISEGATDEAFEKFKNTIEE